MTFKLTYIIIEIFQKILYNDYIGGVNMNLIVAIDQNNGIGKDNNLLTHIPEDMKFFKEMTTGNVVIMGRKTLESFPNKKPLPNRTNIVITGDKNYKVDDAIIANSIENAIEIAKEMDKEIFVIGGASIYKQMLELCDTLYITQIFESFDADTFFPKISHDWKCQNLSEIKEYKNIKFQFKKYTK